MPYYTIIYFLVNGLMYVNVVIGNLWLHKAEEDLGKVRRDLSRFQVRSFDPVSRSSLLRISLPMVC